VKTALVAAVVVDSVIAAVDAGPVETATANADATTKSLSVIYRFEPNGRCQPFGSIYFQPRTARSEDEARAYLFINQSLSMPETFILRDYRPEDFEAVTILWRVAREKSLPEFQRLKGHFFYEDQEHFRSMC
jgi:hypothetical protein